MPGTSTHFAPPELISALSVACVEDPNIPAAADSDLADGSHLRIYAGLGKSFPLAPFAVYRAKSQEASCDFGIKDGAVVDAGVFGIDDGIPAEVTLILPDRTDMLAIGVSLSPLDGDLHRVELVDQRGRVAAVRESAPWSFSAPRPHRLRVTGRAGRVEIQLAVITLETVIGLADHHPFTCIGLPLAGDDGGWEPGDWYLAVHGRRHGEDQVAGGAPKRLNQMDAPNGNLPPIDHTSELARVARTVDDGFLDRLRRMVRDDPLPPWAQPAEVLGETAQATNVQSAATRTANLLQITAIDPGPARYLGFALHEKELPSTVDAGADWDCFVVIAAVAWEHDSVWIGGTPEDRRHGELLDRLALAISSVPIGPNNDHQSIDEARGTVQSLIDAAVAKGCDARLLVAGTLVLPPDIAPAILEASGVERTWDPAQGDAASDTFSVEMSFPPSPLASLVALGRDDGNGLVTTHAKLEGLDAVPDWRAEPRLMGRRAHKVRRRTQIGQIIVDRPEALLSDAGRPAGGPIRYLVYGSDAFGRFGSPATVVVDPPERPLPPPPVLAWSLALQAAAGGGRASPGTISVPFFVQAPGDVDRDRLIDVGERVLVPRVRDLAPGSLAIDAVDISVDGTDQPRLALPNPGTIESPAVPLPLLEPQGSGSVELRVRYVDQDGRPGAWASQRVAFHDLRPPAPFPTVRGLYWTSALGPSPEVELLLEWPAEPNVGYRVYRAGPRTFGVKPDPGDPRGEVAGAVLAKIENDHLRPARSSFGMLPGEPVISNGRARFTARLSRSLEDVTVLRVVPHGPTGAEPGFDDAPFIAVAVPDSRRPVPPVLSRDFDEESGACTITVSTDGFDLAKLRREEPGLFDVGGGGVAPQFRLRRAVGIVSDPVFARVIATDQPLERVEAADGKSEHFSGSIKLPEPLLPFVPYLFWAEVRLPPERRFAPAAAPDEVVEETVITTPDARARLPSMRPFSLHSAALQLMFKPPPPGAPQEVAIAVEAGDTLLRVTVGDPPSAHPKAADRFRLAAWAAIADGPRSPLKLPEALPSIESGEAIFAIDGPPARVWVAYVDPLGRTGAVATAP